MKNQLVQMANFSIMKFLLKIIGFLLFTLTITGCEDFLSVNDNPNAPGSSNLELDNKFSAALMSSVIQETQQMNQIGGFWGGYWGTNTDGVNQYYDLKTYNGPSIRSQRDGISVWEDGYNNLLYYQLILEEAEQNEELFYVGSSKIMQGWHFLRLVDFYNNIPFDEALSGTDNSTPSYEDGQIVYQKSIDLISDGIQDIKNSSATSTAGADDIFFNGDKNRWIKFGNTIKLRALIRQSETDNQSYIQSEIQKIQNEGSGFIAEGETVFVNPGFSSSQPNYFWNTYYRDQGGATTSNYQYIRPTKFLVDQYQDRNDPRLVNYYVSVDGSYNGVIFGNENTSDTQYSAANTSAFLGPEENGGEPAAIFKSPDQPNVFFSSFESLFLQAEAVERGWISGSASAIYETAILESFRYTGIDESLLTDYVQQVEVNFDDANDKINRIIEQKWLALNSVNSIEAWNDYRRLNWPKYPGSIATGVDLDERPLRFMYPETERSTNNANTSLQGNDEMTVSPVWWDQ